ncbi:hypothetical protein Poly30_54840 [Planctomycetes bacterium Poly30]|uniref:Carboxypeptidase regulatory-like domain-containing protein n=2 Tax=Saltatorellus ferox TaxID=2528018 RepID=A0A518F0Q3_9BACT|nr:hypothetical protein Poly30_54840 [Planctomycetes bacterium Poly30]
MIHRNTVHRNTVHRQAGRLRAGILVALVAVAAGGLAALGLLEPAGAPGAASGVAPGERQLSPKVDPADRLGAANRGDRQGLPAEVNSGADRAPATAPAAREPAEETAQWTLQLTILDSARQPIQDARFDVVGPGDVNVLWKRLDGRLEFRVDRPGEYVLTLDGPESDREDVAPFTTAVHRWQAQPGQPETRAEVVLHRAARIVGSFECTDGSSPESAGIDIFHVATEEWSTAAAIDDGTFVSSWMPAGEVIIYSRNGSWSDTDLKDREVLNLSEGQSHAYHGTLAPAIDLTGSVVDTAGRPLASVAVKVRDERNPIYTESVLSEPDGSFLCDGLYPGVYLLSMPKSVDTPDVRFEVRRGTTRVDMGNLVFRRE